MKSALVSIAALSAPLAAFAETSAGNGYVALSKVPKLTDIAGSANLTVFLNNLYNICIGIAVVLAVLQLIRAGVTYMTAAGSVGSTEEAKHLITTSLLGLLLVLSPYIVFSVINPKILDLSINVDGLGTANSTPQATQGTIPGTEGAGGTGAKTEIKPGDQYMACDAASCDSQQRQCENMLGGGTTDHVCRVTKDGTYVQTSYLTAVNRYACPQGSTNYIHCTPNVKLIKACAANSMSSCPKLACDAGTSQHYACMGASGAKVDTLTRDVGDGVTFETDPNNMCPKGANLVIQCE